MMDTLCISNLPLRDQEYREIMYKRIQICVFVCKNEHGLSALPHENDYICVAQPVLVLGI
jgi:hypothetical protein